MPFDVFIRCFPWRGFGGYVFSTLFFKLFKIIEIWTGSKVSVPIPKHFEKVSPELWKIIGHMNQLDRKGVAITLKNEEVNSRVTYKNYRFSGFAQTKGGALYSAGYSLRSEKEAAMKCFAEMIERYNLYNHYPQPNKLRRAVFCELSSAVDPDSFPRPNINYRYKGSLREVPFLWVEGVSLIQQRLSYVPLQVVSLHSMADAGFLDEPPLKTKISTGAAVGTSIESCLVNGISEIIERDAFMLCFLRGESPLAIRKEQLSDDLQRKIAQIEAADTCIHIASLHTDAPVTVAMVTVFSVGKRVFPRFSIGLKTAFDLESAVLGALGEALNERQGLIAAESTLKIRLQKPLNPSRLRNIERLLFWQQDHNFREKIGFLWQGGYSNECMENIQEKNISDLEKLTRYRSFFQTKKYDVVYIDNNVKEIEETRPPLGVTKLKSVFVVIPQMHPLHIDETMPHYQSERLSQCLNKQGKIGKDDHFPHPFY